MGKRATATHLKRGKLLLLLLKQARIDASLTQVQLAQSLGVPQSFVSKYESGERRLDLLELQLVCQGVGTSLVQFVKQFEDAAKSG